MAAPCGAAPPRRRSRIARPSPPKTRSSSGAKSSRSVSDSAMRASLRSVTIPMRGARPRFMSSTPATRVEATAPLTPTIATPIRFMTAPASLGCSQERAARPLRARAASSSCRRRCGGTCPGRCRRVTCSRKRSGAAAGERDDDGRQERDFAEAVLAVDAVLVAERRDRRPRRTRAGPRALRHPELDEERVPGLRGPFDPDVRRGAEVERACTRTTLPRGPRRARSRRASSAPA